MKLGVEQLESRDMPSFFGFSAVEGVGLGLQIATMLATPSVAYAPSPAPVAGHFSIMMPATHECAVQWGGVCLWR